jgi:hypothetical protein
MLTFSDVCTCLIVGVQGDGNESFWQRHFWGKSKSKGSDTADTKEEKNIADDTDESAALGTGVTLHYAGPEVVHPAALKPIDRTGEYQARAKIAVESVAKAADRVADLVQRTNSTFGISSNNASEIFDALNDCFRAIVLDGVSE